MTLEMITLFCEGKVEVVGTIVTDMTFLRDEGHIQPVPREESESGRSYYKIWFELVIEVDGRNLKYSARYPVGGNAQGGGQISLAAAFRPGTN